MYKQSNLNNRKKHVLVIKWALFSVSMYYVHIWFLIVILHHQFLLHFLNETFSPSPLCTKVSAYELMLAELAALYWLSTLNMYWDPKSLTSQYFLVWFVYMFTFSQTSSLYRRVFIIFVKYLLPISNFFIVNR